MVDTVTSRVLRDGNNRYSVHLTNVSDGTSETNVVKIDRSSLTGPNGVDAPSKMSIEEIAYDIQGFTAVYLDWDDSTHQVGVKMSGQNFMDYRHLSNLTPDDHADQVANPEYGDIILTTVGAASDATYDITITVKLKL